MNGDGGCQLFYQPNGLTATKQIFGLEVRNGDIYYLLEEREPYKKKNDIRKVVLPALEGITAKNITAVYSGRPYHIELEGLEEGDVVTYAGADGIYKSTQPQMVNVGTYQVSYRVERGGALLSEGSVSVQIARGNSIYTVPQGCTGQSGSTLADVALPEGFVWSISRTKLVEEGEHVYVAVYNPQDTENYWNENVKVTVTVTCPGHEYDAPELTKRATAQEEGVYTYFCRHCRKSYTESIPRKPETADPNHGLRDPVRYEDGSVSWDTVYFGNYWQNDTNGDGTADRGDKKEPIRWLVLSVEDGEALLLSDKILSGQRNFLGELDFRQIWDIPDWVPDDDPQLHPTSNVVFDLLAGCKWKNSDMRSWLNGYGKTMNINKADYTDDSFMKDAFSASEQAAIPVSNLNNRDAKEYDPDYPENTRDRVFLLSRQEAMMPAYGFLADYSDTNRSAWHTAFAAEEGADENGKIDINAAWSWWTRSTFNDAQILGCALECDSYGAFIDREMYPMTEEIGGSGVRPAIRLDLSDTQLWRNGGALTLIPTINSKEPLLEKSDRKEGTPNNIRAASVKTPVTMEQTKYAALAALASMTMYNTTTAEEVIAAARKAVPDTARLEAAGELIRTPAEAEKAGNAKIQIRITLADGTSDTITPTWGIAPLNGFSEKERANIFKQAKSKANQFAWTVPVSNDTTREELLARLKAEFPDEWCITLIAPYQMQFQARYWNEGNIYTRFLMLCSGWYDSFNFGKDVSRTETMTEDERALSKDMDAIRAAFDKMKITNKTTEADITKVAKAAVKNGSKVAFVKGTFQKTNATRTATGKLSILYGVTHGNARLEIYHMADRTLCYRYGYHYGANREMYKRWEIPKLTDADENTDKNTGKKPSAPKAGTSLKVGKNTYKVLKKGSTVALVKTASTAKSISVPSTITYKKIKYKVTEVYKNAFKNNKRLTKVKLGSNVTKIGNCAFYGCKNLTSITISSKKIKTVGKKAFSGIRPKAKIKVPSGKKNAYKKLFKGKGLSKKAKIV